MKQTYEKLYVVRAKDRSDRTEELASFNLSQLFEYCKREKKKSA